MTHATNEQMIELLAWSLDGIHYVNEKGQPTGYSSDVVDWNHFNPIDNLDHASIIEARLAELNLRNEYIEALRRAILNEIAPHQTDAMTVATIHLVTASAQTRCDAAWAAYQAWKEQAK